MKTKMKLVCSILIFTLILNYSGHSQESKTDYSMAVLAFMDAKIGSEKAFETAAIEHNEKFHNTVPNKAYLDQIMSGSQAGTYVWVQAPCTFTDLGNIDLGDEHENHWNDKVAPHISDYGAVEYWKMNKKLSYYPNPEEEHKFSNIWVIDLKQGEYHRFKALMLKIVEAHEKKGGEQIRVFNNRFNGADGRDVAINWNVKDMASMDMDDGGIKPTYEEINGEGSWANMVKEWQDITKSVNSMLWRVNISK